jgi:hypothetical protein
MALAGGELRKARYGYRESAGHDEQQSRIPTTRYVEKADHPGGIDHFRYAQAESENDPYGQGDGNLNHWKTWRIKKTVNAATTIKIIVAVNERGERRARPQTP